MILDYESLFCSLRLLCDSIPPTPTTGHVLHFSQEGLSCACHIWLGVFVVGDESITFRSISEGYFQKDVSLANSEQMNQFTGNGERQMQMKNTS